MTEEYKICNGCKQSLPVSSFSKSNGANYPRSKCKVCEGNLAKVRKKIKKEVGSPPVDHVCPICLRNESEIKGRGGKKVGSWCCDHNHTTETFRGWLCHDCNRGLGFLGDNVDRLIRAADYLKKKIGRAHV